MTRNRGNSCCWVEIRFENGFELYSWLLQKQNRNALSLRMMTEIVRAVEENQDDKNLRAIVIGSSPGPVFSAGHNLKELVS